MSDIKDKLYAESMGSIPEFIFDQKVVSVFDDMIQRSVPGYRMLISMVALLAQRYYQSGSSVFDLGCSTGANVVAVASALKSTQLNDTEETDKAYNIIAIDNSQAMLAQARKNYEKAFSANNVSWRCEDICTSKVTNASLVIMNYTLQFIPVSQRDALITKIADGIIDGGALLLSEKISYSAQNLDDEMNELYHSFKSANGYSDLEISQKRTALENVLVRETIETHMHRLESAGFSSLVPLFQSFNFVSFLAIK